METTPLRTAQVEAAVERVSAWGRARDAALRALAEAHPDEFIRLLDEAKADQGIKP